MRTRSVQFRQQVETGRFFKLLAHELITHHSLRVPGWKKAYDARSTWLPWLRVEPKFDPLHNDPRFASLLKRLKLES